MEDIGAIFTALWGVWTEMFKAVFPMFRVAVSFLLWVFSAILILPCVFIAGTFYPLWEKWGEEF